MSAHLPLPAAYADPAFRACIFECLSVGELLSQFERLYGERIRCAKPSQSAMRRFCEFVHRSVYFPLGDEALASLRASFAERVGNVDERIHKDAHRERGGEHKGLGCLCAKAPLAAR